MVLCRADGVFILALIAEGIRARCHPLSKFFASRCFDKHDAKYKGDASDRFSVDSLEISKKIISLYRGSYHAR